MVGSFPFVIDFLNSLAIVAGLSWGYGLLRRRLAGPNWAPVALGLLFGCVAVVQMSTPLEPIDGMIIDLRCVPVALAGAFLGWRGALVCVAIAIPARIGFGGVGMSAGVAAIALAALGGLLWHHVTRHAPRRGAWHLIGLVPMMSSSLLGGLLLPPDVAVWFYSEMALPLVATYLIAVPLVGALLERERMLFDQDRVAVLQEEIDGDTGLRGQQRFARDVAHATASGAQAPVSGAIVLTIRDRSFLTQNWGTSAMNQVVGGLRHRFAPLMQNGGFIGLREDGSLLITVSAHAWAYIDDIRAELHRAASDGAMALPNGQSTRVSISTCVVRFTDPANALAVIDDIDAPLTSVRRTRTDPSEATLRPAYGADAAGPLSGANLLLFARADALLRARGA